MSIRALSHRWRSVVALIAILVPAALFAQSAKYVEVPGEREFTGEMIIRPMQIADLRKRGYGELAATLIHNRAAQRVSQFAKEYAKATDEWIVRVPAGFNENTYSQVLMKTGDYQYAEPNWWLYPVRVPNDPLYGQQWHHPVIKADKAWDILIGSPTIICAVVDTGIDVNHQDLAPNRVPGYNSVDRLAEVNGGQVNDLNGHGTHVAGDAAAIGNNGVGVSGVGWNFRIMMIRTSNSSGGGASGADILDGARWAADNGAKSISASYSGVGSAAIGTTGTYIKSKGSLFLYAAGNDNRDLSGFSYPDVIVVGASTPTDTKASFSAYGRGVHVFAPGTSILSTTNGGGYGQASGTSMATPIANGAVAMIFAANPALTAQQVQDALESQCDNIGPSNIFGFGRINVHKSVLRAQAQAAVDLVPTSISTVLGSYSGGTLADILAPNTVNSYRINSVDQIGLGTVAAAEVTYSVPAQPSNVTSLSATFQCAGAQGSLVTAMVYFYNVNTGSFDLMGSAQMSTNSPSFVVKGATRNYSNYVTSNGLCRVMLRGVSTKSALNRLPKPFQLKVHYAQLAYSAQ